MQEYIFCFFGINEIILVSSVALTTAAHVQT